MSTHIFLINHQNVIHTSRSSGQHYPQDFFVFPWVLQVDILTYSNPIYLWLISASLKKENYIKTSIFKATKHKVLFIPLYPTALNVYGGCSY